MNKITAIIVDDEKHCIVTLTHLIAQYCSEIQIVATTQKSTEAKKLIEQHKPNIVFLDIEMPVLNGLELLEQFDTINFQIIFTTAYDQYAIKAIRLNALDYLLKPIDKHDLRATVDKYLNKELTSSKEQILQVQKFTQHKIMDTLALSTQEGLSFIAIKDIIYLEASNNYTYIHTNDGQKNLVSKTLAVFEELLDMQQFFRAHKSYIINLKSIKKYIRGDGGEIIMNNGISISLSRNQKQTFLDLFTKA